MPPPALPLSISSTSGRGTATPEAKTTQNSEIPKTQKEMDEDRRESSSFWTICLYCYYVYEYEAVCKECCLECQNCRRAFRPPGSPGVVNQEEGYFCRIGYFTLGYARPVETDAKPKTEDAGGGGNGGCESGGSSVEISPDDDERGKKKDKEEEECEERGLEYKEDYGQRGEISEDRH